MTACEAYAAASCWWPEGSWWRQLPRQLAVLGAAALGTGCIDAGVGRTLELQQPFAYGPAVIYAANDICRWRDSVFKNSLVKGGGAAK